MKWAFLIKWAVIVGAGLVAIILVIALIGLFLPKAHRATRMARFARPPDVIFAAISGPQDWRGVRVTELPADNGRRRWQEQSGRQTLTFEEAESQPPRRYVSRLADKNLPFSGTWTWEITPLEGGCACRVTEDGEVYNPIFRFVSRFIMGQTKTIEGSLTALGKKFNEPVKIEP